MDTLLPPTGTLVGGRYRVVRAIGKGGMGAVFEAEDTVLDRRVALKVLRRAELDDEAQLARFEREARAVARLNDPNVVGVTDFVRDPTWGPSMVLELLVGESLAQRLTRRPRPSEAELVDIAVQALGALERAHEAGMIHRDLKPPNLFLVTLGSGLVVTKLLDFGIVKLLDGGQPKLTAPDAAIGTPAYMPVEQALGSVIDARADVYAMGAVLYEAISGELPYPDGDPMQVIGAILAGPPRDLADVAPDVSPGLATIVMRAMARAPEDRYPSAAAMRAALRSVRLMPAGWRQRVTPPTRDASTVQARPAREKESPPELPAGVPRGVPRWAIAVGLLAVALAIFALGWRSHASVPAAPILAPAPAPLPPPPTPAPAPPSSPPPPVSTLPAPAPPLAPVSSAPSTPRARPPRPIAAPPPSAPPRTSSLDDAPLDPFGTR
ncbi:MAG: serine/threonine-protein kinase [Sandaracinus sp.]